MQIGALYHVIHLVEDRAPLDAWYDELFMPRRGFMDANYYEFEQRDASLITIADAVVEVLAPARFATGWDAMPIGRFFTRFGRHWHSIAWYVDDVGEAYDHLRACGLRVIFPGGAADDDTRPGAYTPIFTHPKETLTQLQFFTRRPIRGAEEFAETPGFDPRFYPGWSSRWWADHHPLGLERLAYLTIVTGDLDRARSVYVDALGGKLLDESTSNLTATDDVYVKVGEQTVVQLSRPHDTGSIARADHERYGDMLHAVAWRVRNLDAAGRFLSDRGVRIVARDDETLVMDPSHTFGAPFRFTTASFSDGS